MTVLESAGDNGTARGSSMSERLGRRDFFKWFALGMAIEIAIIVIGILLTHEGWPAPVAATAWGIFLIGVLIPRRLRDIGWSVWLAPLILIPFVNLAFLIFLLSKPAGPGQPTLTLR